MHLLQVIAELVLLVGRLHVQEFTQLVLLMAQIEDPVIHPQMNMLLSQLQVVSIQTGMPMVLTILFMLMLEMIATCNQAIMEIHLLGHRALQWLHLTARVFLV